MNKVVLIFPNMASMAEFILSEKIAQAETNTLKHSLITLLTDDQIETACRDFGALLKQITRVKR